MRAIAQNSRQSCRVARRDGPGCGGLVGSFFGECRQASASRGIWKLEKEANAGTSASSQTPFWQEVRQAEGRRREVRRENFLRRLPRRKPQEEIPEDEVSNESTVDDFLRSGTGSLGGSSEQRHPSASSSADVAQPSIRAVDGEEQSAEGAVSAIKPGDPEPAGLPPVLSPAHERLLACRSAGSVLGVSSHAAAAVSAGGAEATERLGELALALHLLARWASGFQRAALIRDGRLHGMLSVLGAHASELETWAVVASLWGIARLGVAHACTGQLLGAAGALASELQLDQAALMLRSLGFSPQLGSSKAARELQEALVNLVQERGKELSPRTAATLVPALVQLRVADSNFTALLADHVARSSMLLDVRDMAAAAAGLVTLRTVDRMLPLRTQSAIQRSVHLCTPRSVVQFSVALRDSAQPDTFRDYLMPAARSFILDFNPRDLCTLAEAFSRVQLPDPDFLADLAHSLQPKVSEMSVHDVSIALSIFAPVGHAVPQLLPAVAGRVRDVVDEFSPRQLARTLHGLSASSCSDKALYDALRSRIIELSHVLYGTNAVDALLALTEAGHLNGHALDALSGAIRRSLDRLPLGDHVAALYVVARIPKSLQEHIPDGLADELLHGLARRSRGTWRVEGGSLTSAVHLLEALRSLWREDEVLVELICRQLPASLGGVQCSLELLLRLLSVLGELPPQSCLHVRTHLHRRPKLQEALHESLAKQLASGRLDTASQVELVRACARLGFENQSTQAWLDRLVHDVESNAEVLPSSVVCDFCWTLAEMNWQIDWNRRFLQTFLQRRYPDWAASHAEDKAAVADEPGLESDSIFPGYRAPIPQDSLIRLSWALTVLNDSVPAPLLVEMHAALDGALPSERSGTGLRLLQAVALHRSMADKSSQDDLPLEVREWLELVREVPREDLHTPQALPRAQRKRRRPSAKQYPHEHWLSAALSQLRLPHQTGAVLVAHRAAIAFRHQWQVIDVLALEDLSAPAGRVLGGAELRQRQFMQQGWAVHSVKLRDLYDAVRGGTVRLLVSKLLSSFDPGAARRSSFRSSVVGGPAAPPLRLLPARSNSHSPLDKSAAEDSDLGLWDEEEDLQEGLDDAASSPLGPSLRPRDPRAALHERAIQAVAAISRHGRVP